MHIGKVEIHKKDKELIEEQVREMTAASRVKELELENGEDGTVLDYSEEIPEPKFGSLNLLG